MLECIYFPQEKFSLPSCLKRSVLAVEIKFKSLQLQEEKF